MTDERKFIPLNIAIMTVSDTRDEKTDTSGAKLVQMLKAEGHILVDKKIVADDRYLIRETLSRWIADANTAVVITTGGTGLTGRDGTPEAVSPLLDKRIDGFGEMFRMLSYQKIKTSTLQSRAMAGVANSTFVFCLPGSTGACKDGWNMLICEQLDYRTQPCNLVELIPRLDEK